MDCVTAQQVISAALDREPVDTYQLEEAKEHCRTCTECGVFVRAQLVTQQVPLPAPPADLADRVMAQVRAEAAQTAALAEAAERAAAEEIAAAEAASAAARAAATPLATLAPKPRTARKLPRIWVSAAAAAAVLVALIGTGGIVIFGMKQMGGQTGATSETYQSRIVQGAAPGVATDLSASGTAAESAEATGAQSITVNGTVYRVVGGATVSTATATVVGSTNTALDGSGSIQKRDVYALASAAERVYVADDNGQLLEFARVTRTYAGLVFVMTSPELTGFAQWPALPTQITPPTSADGSPTFVFDGTDSSGTRVYRLANSTATQGIAIGPDTPAGDPAAGNPNWTWWAISR
jgi:hypothetical protein